MFNLGGQEIIIILLVIGLLFGAKKLPDLGKSFGSAIREFKKEMNPGSSDGEAKENGSTEKDGKQ